MCIRDRISVTESQIMNEGVHSTPVMSKKAEDNDINYNSESIVGVKNNGENTDECVECDYEMLVCVKELEREWKNNIVVEWLSLIHI